MKRVILTAALAAGTQAYGKSAVICADALVTKDDKGLHEAIKNLNFRINQEMVFFDSLEYLEEGRNFKDLKSVLAKNKDRTVSAPAFTERKIGETSKNVTVCVTVNEP